MSKIKSKRIQWLKMAAVVLLCVTCLLLPASKRADASKKRLSLQFKSLLEDGKANYLDALDKRGHPAPEHGANRPGKIRTAIYLAEDALFHRKSLS